MFRRVQASLGFWAVVLVLAAAFFVLVLLSALYVDSGNESAIAAALRNLVDGSILEPLLREFGAFASNDTVAGVFMSLAAAAVSVSLIYLFKMPDMRRIAIESLAYGYYQNFIRHLITHCIEQHAHFRILIIIPSYELVEQPEIYWKTFQSFLKREGFSLADARTDGSFARHSFLVQRKNLPEPLPLYVDVPTTMRSLTKVLELEANTPVGQLPDAGWARQRFDRLAGYFMDAIQSYMPQESFGNLRFVRSDSVQDFSRRVSGEVDKLEQELEDYRNS
ncbi:STING domain-containing protein [Elongatibacter sediminis]|uniref:STING domain-containing protein n=1 Tax=Elongatibacter sediminis TaxID=3119006 RepID=A0AAW9RFL8_9GAMM